MMAGVVGDLACAGVTGIVHGALHDVQIAPWTARLLD
jgi:hypothetical protein